VTESIKGEGDADERRLGRRESLSFTESHTAMEPGLREAFRKFFSRDWKYVHCRFHRMRTCKAKQLAQQPEKPQE